MTRRLILLTISIGLLLAACTTPQQPTPAPEATTDQTQTAAPTEAGAEAGATEPATTAPESSDAQDAAIEVNPVSAEQIADKVWQWTELVEVDPPSQSVVPDPTRYTITFNTNNTADIRADCNNILADYTLDGNSLTLALGPTTQVFCGEDSLDVQFVAGLNAVTGIVYESEADRLRLIVSEDAGFMGFADGGASSTGEQPEAETEAPATGLAPEAVTIDTQGTPYTPQPVQVPESPYDASMPPGPVGLPAHVQVQFAGADSAESGPIMHIIPVDAYRNMWDAAGSSSVSDKINAIYDLTVSLPSTPPTSGVAALPTEQTPGVNDLAVQLGRITPTDESASKNGYRFIGRFAQSPNPVTNQDLQYIYQGFTNDGTHLVTLFYPIATSALPATAADVSDKEMSLLAENPSTYLQAKAEELNALTADQWEPSLTTLDAMVASLAIDGMAASGLFGTWQLVAQRDASGNEQPLPVEPANVVTYATDGSVAVQAECNTSSGTTEIRDTARSGLVGGMLTQLGPTTLAQCGPDSNSELMLNTVAAAQDYRVRPGGTMLELISPAGGPVLLLTPADAVSAESESGTDSAEATPQPAPQPAPDATAVPSEEPTQSVAGLSPDSIQMELQGLATTFAWEVVAATPVPPGPGGQGFPQHIVLTFDGAAADDVSTYGPIMRIFPVVPYIDLYGSEGQNIVSDQVFRLASLVLEANGRQSVPESPMPLLPPPGSFMNRWAQFADLNFAQGAGVRYVSDSPFRQALGPWTNETTAYYYQGLSDDGAFYISLVWPVATSTLPDSEASVSAETMEQASNPETSAAYHSEVIATLNAVPDAEWSPTLEQLDALVSSLTFVDNP